MTTAPKMTKAELKAKAKENWSKSRLKKALKLAAWIWGIGITLIVIVVIIAASQPDSKPKAAPKPQVTHKTEAKATPSKTTSDDPLQVLLDNKLLSISEKLEKAVAMGNQENFPTAQATEFKLGYARASILDEYELNWVHGDKLDLVRLQNLRDAGFVATSDFKNPDMQQFAQDYIEIEKYMLGIKKEDNQYSSTTKEMNRIYSNVKKFDVPNQ